MLYKKSMLGEDIEDTELSNLLTNLLNNHLCPTSSRGISVNTWQAGPTRYDNFLGDREVLLNPLYVVERGFVRNTLAD